MVLSILSVRSASLCVARWIAKIHNVVVGLLLLCLLALWWQDKG